MLNFVKSVTMVRVDVRLQVDGLVEIDGVSLKVFFVQEILFYVS